MNQDSELLVPLYLLSPCVPQCIVEANTYQFLLSVEDRKQRATGLLKTCCRSCTQPSSKCQGPDVHQEGMARWTKARRGDLFIVSGSLLTITILQCQVNILMCFLVGKIIILPLRIIHNFVGNLGHFCFFWDNPVFLSFLYIWEIVGPWFYFKCS